MTFHPRRPTAAPPRINTIHQAALNIHEPGAQSGQSPLSSWASGEGGAEPLRFHPHQPREWKLKTAQTLY